MEHYLVELAMDLLREGRAREEVIKEIQTLAAGRPLEEATIIVEMAEKELDK